MISKKGYKLNKQIWETAMLPRLKNMSPCQKEIYFDGLTMHGVTNFFYYAINNLSDTDYLDGTRNIDFWETVSPIVFEHLKRIGAKSFLLQADYFGGSTLVFKYASIFEIFQSFLKRILTKKKNKQF